MRSLPILLLFAVCLTPALLLAQSETSADQESVSQTEAVPAPDETTDDVDGAETSAQEEQEKQRKKQKLEIGLILTSAIVILGIFLVVLTLLYGRRTKRQIAAGRGPTPPRDDLWYLKKSRESSSANASDAEQEGDLE